MLVLSPSVTGFMKRPPERDMSVEPLNMLAGLRIVSGADFCAETLPKVRPSSIAKASAGPPDLCSCSVVLSMVFVDPLRSLT